MQLPLDLYNPSTYIDANYMKKPTSLIFLFILKYFEMYCYLKFMFSAESWMEKTTDILTHKLNLRCDVLERA